MEARTPMTPSAVTPAPCSATSSLAAPGACDRYANHDGQLVRLDPHVVLDRAVSRGDTLVPFLESDANGTAH